MRILVTGASGFIASQIVTDLINAGHQVTCCVRNVAYMQRILPTAKVIQCNFKKDVKVSDWLPRLKDIDIVINCVGILYHPNKKIIWAIHADTPKALFAACVEKRIKKVIQLSALGVDRYDVDYATSKKAADDYLNSLPIPSVILRPSLVYGRGSYGGTSLFRGMAGIPFVTPVPGNGNQLFQPIHIEDLSKAVLRLIEREDKGKYLLTAVGPGTISLTIILQTLRSWLGFGKSIMLHVPLFFIRFVSLFGNLIPYSSTNMTSYKMLMQNNVADEENAKQFHELIGFMPVDFISGVYRQPSSVQDHWHARLYYLKPLLQVSLSFLWIFTAICSLFLFPHDQSYKLLATVGIDSEWRPFFLYSAGILDGILGVGMLFNFQIRKIVALQILVTLFYTLIITWKLPALWRDPFAPIVKNIPLLVATIIYLAMESDK